MTAMIPSTSRQAFWAEVRENKRKVAAVPDLVAALERYMVEGDSAECYEQAAKALRKLESGKEKRDGDNE